MAKYQKRVPETAEFVLDKEGNGHEIDGGVLTGKVIPKATFEAEWGPLQQG